jgi:hypothetical protein
MNKTYSSSQVVTYRKKAKPEKFIFSTLAIANAPRKVYDMQKDGFKP